MNFADCKKLRYKYDIKSYFILTHQGKLYEDVLDDPTCSDVINFAIKGCNMYILQQKHIICLTEKIVIEIDKIYTGISIVDNKLFVHNDSRVSKIMSFVTYSIGDMSDDCVKIDIDKHTNYISLSSWMGNGILKISPYTMDAYLENKCKFYEGINNIVITDINRYIIGMTGWIVDSNFSISVDHLGLFMYKKIILRHDVLFLF